MRKDPKQRRSREMVAKIIAAAEQLADADGLDALTTNRIAEAAGISKGSLYQYFATKDEVIEAAVRAAEQRDVHFIRETLESIALEPPVAMLDRSVDFLVEVATSRRIYLRYLVRNRTRQDQQLGAGLADVLQAMTVIHIRRYRDQYRDDVDDHAIAWLIVHAASLTVFGYLELGDPVPLPSLQAGLKHMLHGLLREPPAAIR